ncbi:SFL1 Transcription factor SFL1 [Candida maltosa Xu316]
MNPPIDMKSNNILNPTTSAPTATTTTTTTPSSTIDSKSASNNNNNSTGKTQIVFIHKLYDMLHDDSISHLIWWSPTLDSFYVTPGEEFSKVLSQYFKHTNIASFIRQLNMYGFHKVNETFLNQEDQTSQQQQQQQQANNNNRWEFRHSTNQFRKGDTESLKHIKRRSSKTLNSQKEVVNIKSLPPTSQPIDYSIPYASDEQNHYFAANHHHPSITSPSTSNNSISGPSIDMKPRSPSTPIPLPHHQQQMQQQRQQSMINQSPQEYNINRPSIIKHQSFENATHFKLLDLNNQINMLRNDFFNLNNRYELLQNELKYQTTDSITILDICERISSNDNRLLNDVRNLKNLINQRIQRLTTQLVPQHIQPVPIPVPVPVPQPGSISGPVPPPQVPPPPSQPQSHNPSISSNYHLDASSKNPSRNPSTTNLNPHPYPLNPHYSIYNNIPDNGTNGGFFRKREESNSKRNLSVYDPLQPVPSRHNSRILVTEEPQVPSLGNPTFRSRAESTYSPLSHVGKQQQQQQQSLKPPTPQPLVKPPTPQPLVKPPTPQPVMKPPTPIKPQTPKPSTSSISSSSATSMTSSLSTRTNSLPNPKIDHLTPHQSSPYYIQRNSFTSMYEHTKSFRMTSPNKFGNTPPRSTDTTTTNPPEKSQQLPSVSELVNKNNNSNENHPSLLPSILNKPEPNENNDPQGDLKRRKVE